MTGPIIEGTYKLDGNFVRVEIRQYPRKRYIVKRLGADHAELPLPYRELTREMWERMETWL